MVKRSLSSNMKPANEDIQVRRRRELSTKDEGEPLKKKSKSGRPQRNNIRIG